MIKTNLITGFLGSGKTTTIQHLLSTKPDNEKWAVLINEFGEIGIDGALLSDSGAVLKEIPGGCMCCVNGLPMQVGLNMLIQQAKPDRLLIEPTGLGHPKQILNLLTSDVYQPILDLRATLCLLDARQLSDQRYYDNENFRDQLAAADIIIANKTETYQPEDSQRLTQWQTALANGRPVVAATHGQIDRTLLDAARINNVELADAQHHPHQQPHKLASLHLPENSSWRRALNHGQGYFSCGWIFDADSCFNTAALLDWVRLSPVDRVKGIMRIAEGTLIVNRQGFDLKIETRPFPPVDSRIELIHSQEAPWNTLQASLLSARLN